MTEKRDEEPDPTSDFLDGVRTGETPWRTERPADQEPVAEPGEAPPSRWRRAAPYIQGAAVAGWVATAAVSGLSDDDDAYQDGYDAGFDAGGSSGG